MSPVFSGGFSSSEDEEEVSFNAFQLEVLWFMAASKKQEIFFFFSKLTELKIQKGPHPGGFWASALVSSIHG